MQENRNTSLPRGLTNCASGSATVCIDTKRILDCCRDRDCFEDTRVYLTSCGEEILSSANNVRTRSAKLLWAYVGVDEVPFNCGFYRISVRYYIEIELEACLGVGKSQNLRGLAALEKEVVLYGGEGGAVSYTSNCTSFCEPGSCSKITNEPTAVVETVEPIILGSKVVDCSCVCSSGCTEYPDIPDGIRCCLGEEIVTGTTAPRLYVSLGIFSVIRLERPAQLLVTASDYSVPDKECTPAQNGDSPCDLFRTIAFPVAQFRATECCRNTESDSSSHGGCGCNKNS